VKRTNKAAIVAGAIIVATGATAGIATAVGGDDSEAPITGQALDRAKAAALEHTGEGQVTETEVGDEESYYEVEVTLDNGDETDVQLNKDFSVVGSETETETETDNENDD